jgi:hypothetical protein
LSKKTCQLIIEGGNDYVIAVKGNQKNLHRQLRLNTENTPPASRYIATERTRNRVTTRTVQVFHDLTGISHEWIGLKSLIKVERTGTRGSKPYHQVAYYISSLVGTLLLLLRVFVGIGGLRIACIGLRMLKCYWILKI